MAEKGVRQHMRALAYAVGRAFVANGVGCVMGGVRACLAHADLRRPSLEAHTH